MSLPTSVTDKSSILVHRLGATASDTFILMILIVIVNRLLPAALYERWEETGAVTGAVLVLAYYVLFEGWWGATPGKYFGKIRVIDSQGRAPGLLRAAIRTALRLIEVNPLLFGGIPAYVVFRLSRYGQRAGDLFARTFVVRIGDVPRIRAGELNVGSLRPTD